jgi:hypothetical protein
MPRHPVFKDLPLHSDAELSALLGAAIVERSQVHAWPLSSVERVRLADGRTLAYKSQLPPTVEPAFYSAVASPLLPGHRSLGALGAAQTMVLEWIDGPLLSDLAPDPGSLVRHGRAILAALSSIDPAAPVWLDIGSPAAWSRIVEQTCADWRQVIDAGWFRRSTERSVAFVRRWASTPAVLATIEAGGRIVHADLKADQVFVTGAVPRGLGPGVVTSPPASVDYRTAHEAGDGAESRAGERGVVEGRGGGSRPADRGAGEGAGAGPRAADHRAVDAEPRAAGDRGAADRGVGYRVIDWQRPALAPPEVDMVSLLVGQGVDPAPHVDPPAIGIYWFMLLHWAVHAQHTLFPGSSFPLFDGWARQSVDGIRATAG